MRKQWMIWGLFLQTGVWYQFACLGIWLEGKRETGLEGSQTLLNSIALKNTNDACVVCLLLGCCCCCFFKGAVFCSIFLTFLHLHQEMVSVKHYWQSNWKRAVFLHSCIQYLLLHSTHSAATYMQQPNALYFCAIRQMSAMAQFPEWLVIGERWTYLNGTFLSNVPSCHINKLIEFQGVYHSFQLGLDMEGLPLVALTPSLTVYKDIHGHWQLCLNGLLWHKRDHFKGTLVKTSLKLPHTCNINIPTATMCTILYQSVCFYIFLEFIRIKER